MFKVYKNGNVVGQINELSYAAPINNPLTEQDEAIAELGILTAGACEEIEALKERIRQLEARLPEGESNG